MESKDVETFEKKVETFQELYLYIFMVVVYRSSLLSRLKWIGCQWSGRSVEKGNTSPRFPTDSSFHFFRPTTVSLGPIIVNVHSWKLVGDGGGGGGWPLTHPVAEGSSSESPLRVVFQEPKILGSSGGGLSDETPTREDDLSKPRWSSQSRV